MRVLSISGPLPRPGRPGSLAPVARQIESVRRLGIFVEVIEVDGPKGLKYPAAWPRLITRCRSVDVVHGHFGYSGWLGLLQPWRPVVISFMGNDLLGRRRSDGHLTLGSRAAIRLNRIAARRASAVIVKSREMASVLPGSDTQVIPNGVDMVRFAPIDRLVARDRLGWPSQEIAVLFPGCPEFPNKGYDVARDAVAQAALRIRQPIALKILWNVDPTDVPLYMSACDAMILASQHEGSPNVVKEALSCELPVVATPVGDVPELLADATGCQVRPRDAVALGEALASAIHQGRLRDGRRILLRHQLDEESVARRLVALYDWVIH